MIVKILLYIYKMLRTVPSTETVLYKKLRVAVQKVFFEVAYLKHKKMGISVETII